MASFNHPGRERKPGSIGTPIRGVQMRVVDKQGHEVARGEVGEIVICGHNVMKGYCYSICPREVGEVLYEHPAVVEAAVIGLPHPALGAEVGAAVALKAGATVTAEELRGHVRTQVAAYKYPRKVRIVDVLPKGPTDKILRQEIVLPADQKYVQG